MTVLFLILAAIVMSSLLGLFLVRYDEYGFVNMAGLIITTVSALAAIGFAVGCFGWVSAQYKTDIINKEFGTSYTREDVYFASDVIEAIHGKSKVINMITEEK